MPASPKLISLFPDLWPLAAWSVLMLSITRATSVAGAPVLNNLATDAIWSSVNWAVKARCVLTVANRSCRVGCTEGVLLVCTTDRLDDGGAGFASGSSPAANISFCEAEVMPLGLETGELGCGRANITDVRVSATKGGFESDNVPAKTSVGISGPVRVGSFLNNGSGTALDVDGRSTWRPFEMVVCDMVGCGLPSSTGLASRMTGLGSESSVLVIFVRRFMQAMTIIPTITKPPTTPPTTPPTIVPVLYYII
jgi:hypothetical protein